MTAASPPSTTTPSPRRSRLPTPGSSAWPPTVGPASASRPRSCSPWTATGCSSGRRTTPASSSGSPTRRGSTSRRATSAAGRSVRSMSGHARVLGRGGGRADPGSAPRPVPHRRARCSRRCATSAASATWSSRSSSMPPADRPRSTTPSPITRKESPMPRTTVLRGAGLDRPPRHRPRRLQRCQRGRRDRAGRSRRPTQAARSHVRSGAGRRQRASTSTAPTGLCAIFPSDRAAAALGEPVGRGSDHAQRRPSRNAELPLRLDRPRTPRSRSGTTPA